MKKYYEEKQGIYKYSLNGKSAEENYMEQRKELKEKIDKYMEDNSDGDRKQNLPEVSDVTVISDEEIEYEIGEEKFEAYKINIDISYVKDLKYDKKAEVILVKEDKYLYVVEKN